MHSKRKHTHLAAVSSSVPPETHAAAPLLLLLLFLPHHFSLPQDLLSFHLY